MSDNYRDPFERVGAGTNQESDELSAWLAWLQQLGTLGASLVSLMGAEARLAAGDFKRLLLVGLFIFPILILTWISFTVFLSWLVYSQTGSPGAGFFVWFALQAACAWYLRSLIKKYRRSLGFPATRQHLADIMEDVKSGT